MKNKSEESIEVLIDSSLLQKFPISIADGFCEWTYVLHLPENMSIHDIATKICKTFNIPLPEKVIYRSCTGALSHLDHLINDKNKMEDKNECS